MDGLSAKVPKDKIKFVESIIKEVGVKYNFTFEDTFYNKMIFQNVNSYLAIDEKNNIKRKGEFVTNPELGNSVDELIIAKSLNEYFINNIKPEEFITNHKNIFDFCISQKVHKSYKVWWTNPQFEKVNCQNVNRYYASKKGGYLFKERNNSISNLLVSSGVMIYNKHQDTFPTDINYEYYINKVNRLIRDIRTSELNPTLFD